MPKVDWLSWIFCIETEDFARGLSEHTHRQKFVVTRETQSFDAGMDITPLGPGPMFCAFIGFTIAIGQLFNFPYTQMNAAGIRQASSKNF